MFEDIYIYFRIPVNNDGQSLHCSEHIKITRTQRRVSLFDEWIYIYIYMHVKLYGGNLIGHENSSSDNNTNFPVLSLH